MTTDYITEADFRGYVRDKTTLDMSMVLDAITAASREIDAMCGRFFYQQTATQFYRPESIWTCDLEDNDIANTTGLVVSTETGNDGTYPNVLTNGVDFLLEPVNQSSGGITPWPFTWMRAIGGKIFPPSVGPFWRPTVRVVATYGWPAVPAAIKQATKMKAAELYKAAESPFGVAGFGAFGAVRVRDNPMITSLLAPYVKSPGGYIG